MNGQTRRDFLTGVGATAAASLAGCTGLAATGGSNGDQSTAQASFFVVADFAANVTGDAMAVEPLVPFGQHGHGWEPGPTIQRTVSDAAAFVYVGDGFQPWADKVVQNLHEDEADVPVVEAWADVDLLPIDESHDDHTDGDHDEHEADGDHEDHDDHETEHTEETHDEDHDDGSGDPHFWLDPVRAKQSVNTIQRGLSAVLPDQTDVLEANATAYVERLDGMHATFEERLAGRTRDTVLFAGHNSFRYLGHRFDFTVASLSGLAPDETPSPKAIAEAQALVDEHDIEYVLAPVFESDQAAHLLVEQTDAVDVLPLTPVPTLTAAWADDGLDFVDVMETVNLESLATALGAE